MASYDEGKQEIVEWIRKNFPRGSTCLDVGACDGKWKDLLGDYLIMDAVEIWWPNIEGHELARKYRKVIHMDIADYAYPFYDLIIFGDVIEHMDVTKAQKVLSYAAEHSRDMVVGVPYKYKQGALYGNPNEEHIQDDLTGDIMAERYPNLELILQARGDYGYYHGRPPYRKLTQ